MGNDWYERLFEVYQGKSENKSIQNLPKVLGLDDRINCQMTASLHNKYHEVYTGTFLYQYFSWSIFCKIKFYTVVRFALIRSTFLKIKIWIEELLTTTFLKTIL